MKRKITALCLLAAAMTLLTPPTQAADCGAKCAIVYEPRTGTVLYEKDADAQMLVASTTKIMTALVVLERCALDEPVEVTAAHTAVEGSSMYLQPGGEHTVEDLLYGLLLASGNDAAAALADHCAGSMTAFAALMNETCEALGLQNTHFVNAHGLDAPGHYSSARDLAIITAAAMENADFCNIFATRSHSCNGQTYVNHNKLLSSCEGCIGGKTGYTRAAGRVLVSCAEREGLRLICVTIADPDDWTDHAALYDACFADYRYLPLPASSWERLPVICGEKSCAKLCGDVPGILVPKEAELRLGIRLPRFVFAPVRQDAALGTVDVYLDGVLQRTIPLTAAEAVPLDSTQALSVWEQFKRAWFRSNRYGARYSMI